MTWTVLACVLARGRAAVALVPRVRRCSALLKAVTTAVVTTGGVKTATVFAGIEAGFAALLKAGLLVAEVATRGAVVKATTVVAVTVATEVTATGGGTATTETTTCVGVIALAAKAVTATAHGFAGFGHAHFGLQAWNHFGLERLACVGLDVTDLAAVTNLSEGHSQAVAASAACTANAVGIVLGLHRQAEVKDVGDGGHVNAASGHVGGDQNLDLTVAQRHQAAVAHTLAQSTVQGHSREAVLLQVSGQAVALDLGAGEHDGLVDRGVTQPMVEHLALVLGVVGPEKHLLDVVVLFLGVVDLDFLDRRTAVVHHAHGQLLNARRKGGAEHHGLATLAGHVVDVGQVVREAQIEHAVSFVHYQKLHLVQFDLHGALQVQQTAGCGNHQVGVLQLGNLQLVRHAADHVGNAQTTRVLDQLDGVLRHLLGQFARWADYQGARCRCLEVAWVGGVFALGALRGGFAFGNGVGAGLVEFGAFSSFLLGHLLNQGVQNGQQKGGGFAAAGLAGHHHVGVAIGLAVFGAACSGQSQRNGAQLHSGWLGVAQIGHGLHQLRGQAQLNETVRHVDDGFDFFGHCSRGFRSGFGGDFGRRSDHDFSGQVGRGALCRGLGGDGCDFGRRQVVLHCVQSVGHVYV